MLKCEPRIAVYGERGVVAVDLRLREADDLARAQLEDVIEWVAAGFFERGRQFGVMRHGGKRPWRARAVEAVDAIGVAWNKSQRFYQNHFVGCHWVRSPFFLRAFWGGAIHGAPQR